MLKKKLEFFPTAMTVCSFICFILVYVDLTYNSVAPMYLEGLLFAIPFLTFLGITIASYRGKIGFMTSGLCFILGIVFVVAAFILLLVLSFPPSNTVDDPAYYERIVRVTDVDEGFEGLLPKHIPYGAQNVKLHYNPPFMQGEARFSFSFEVDAVTFNEYEASLKTKAKWSGTYEQAETEKINVLLPYTLRENYSLPDEYVFYLINAEPFEYETYVNHGSSYTIAVNKETSEIFFDASSW